MDAGLLKPISGTPARYRLKGRYQRDRCPVPPDPWRPSGFGGNGPTAAIGGGLPVHRSASTRPPPEHVPTSGCAGALAGETPARSAISCAKGRARFTGHCNRFQEPLSEIRFRHHTVRSPRCQPSARTRNALVGAPAGVRQPSIGRKVSAFGRRWWAGRGETTMTGGTPLVRATTSGGGGEDRTPGAQIKSLPVFH
jgi:hypothetical protein